MNFVERKFINLGSDFTEVIFLLGHLPHPSIVEQDRLAPVRRQFDSPWLIYMILVNIVVLIINQKYIWLLVMDGCGIILQFLYKWFI